MTRIRAFLAENRLNLCLLILSVLIAAVLAEVAYRVTLARMAGEAEPHELNFSVQDKSCWDHDAALGFRYKPGVSVDWTAIQRGLPALAGTLSFDRRGNSGPEVDDAGAEVRIAVVGDSFTVIQHDGVTWPYLLQQLLRERTGRKVAVYNHARDGYGVLQMIEQASRLVDERPDAILVAFITPDLVRGRFWRTEAQTAGGVEVFTSTTPTLQLDRPETYVRTMLIDPRATRAWAEGVKAKRDRNDPVLRSLIDTFLRERNNHYVTRFDPFSLKVSYLWNRVAQPRVQALGTGNSQVTFTDFTADKQFMAGIGKIKRSGVPVHLVHLAWLPDLLRGSYDIDPRHVRLLDSLRITSGFPLVETLPAAPMGLDVDRMVISRDNSHPSLDGLKHYAEKTAQALVGRQP